MIARDPAGPLPKVKNMDLVNDLENDLAFAVLTGISRNGEIDSEHLLPLMSRIRTALQPVAGRDHVKGDTTLSAKAAGEAS